MCVRQIALLLEIGSLSAPGFLFVRGRMDEWVGGRAFVLLYVCLPRSGLICWLAGWLVSIIIIINAAAAEAWHGRRLNDN